MPMTANVCERHGAYYTDKCGQCAYEEWKNLSEASRQFFLAHARSQVRMRSEDKESWEWIDVEDLYQRFRVRLIEELEPVFKKQAQDMQSMFETAYNAGVPR